MSKKQQKATDTGNLRYLCEELDLLIHLTEDHGGSGGLTGDGWAQAVRKLLADVDYKLRWPLRKEAP